VPDPTVVLRRAGQSFVTQGTGRITRHCFSFADHYDPANVSYAALLVCNDDRLLSDAGYPDHPHRDAEIVTWVLSGSLVHEDSHGHRGVVHRGLAQRMSAGSGIIHAERNDAYRFDPAQPPTPAHVVQMWLRPDESGTMPAYAQRELDLNDLRADWVPVASGQNRHAAIDLGSRGSTLWVTQLGPGACRLLPEHDHLHIYVARGEAELETVGTLAAGDSVRISGRAAFKITGRRAAEVMVWGMAS
jgi:quercetin 2,3-dioxygenase